MVEVRPESFLKARPLPRVRLGLMVVAAIGLGLMPYAIIIKSATIWLTSIAIAAIAAVVCSGHAQSFPAKSHR